MAELKFEQIFKGIREEIVRLKEETKTIDKDISTVKLQELNKRLTQLVAINKKLDTSSKQRLKTQQALSIEYQKRAAAEKRAAKNVRDLAKAEEVLEAITRRQVKSINDLQVRTNALVTKRRLLDKSTKEGSKQFRRLTKEIAKNDKQLKKLDKQIGRSQRNVGNYARAFNRLLGAAVGGVGLYGVVRVFGDMIKIFKSFEQANKKLQSILGVSSKEMNLLVKQSKSLGAITAFTATEITGLQTELAKLGFTLPQIEASTEGILSLAAATGTELSEAASLAGSAIRIFGLDASESARVADVLALSTSKSALDMQKLSAALPIVGTTAKQAGLNIEQTTALLGTLADRGIDASTSATSLRNIFLELSKKGLTFNEAMEMIRNSTDKSKTAMDLFGKRAATAGVILSETETSTKDLELALNEASGAAKDMADVMLDNLAGDMTLAQSAWEGMVLSIEDGSGVVSESIRAIIQTFTKLFTLIVEINKHGALGTAVLANSDEVKKNISDYEDYINKTEKYLKSIEKVSDGTFEGRDITELERKQKIQAFYTKEIKKQKEEFDKYLKLEKEDNKWNQLRLEAQLKLGVLESKLVIAKTKTENKSKTLSELELEALKNEKERNKAIEERQKLLLEEEFALKRMASNLQLRGDGKIPDILIPKAEDLSESLFDAKTFEKVALANVPKFKLAMLKFKYALFGEGGNFFTRLFGDEAGTEIQKIAIDTISQLLGQLGNALVNSAQQQTKANEELLNSQDAQIAKTQEQLDKELDRINKLKTAGQAYDTTIADALSEKLAREQAARKETERRNREFRQKEKRAAVIQASIDLASGIMQIWGGKDEGNFYVKLAKTIALGLLGAVQIGTISSQQFAEGTEYATLNGNPKGTDTIPAMINEGERIIPTKNNMNIPRWFPNDLVPDAINEYINGNNNKVVLNQYDNRDILTDIEKNTRNDKVFKDGKLITEYYNNMIVHYG